MGLVSPPGRSRNAALHNDSSLRGFAEREGAADNACSVPHGAHPEALLDPHRIEPVRNRAHFFSDLTDVFVDLLQLVWGDRLALLGRLDQAAHFERNGREHRPHDVVQLPAQPPLLLLLDLKQFLLEPAPLGDVQSRPDNRGCPLILDPPPVELKIDDLIVPRQPTRAV